MFFAGSVVVLVLSIVIVALPDQIHFEVTMDVLRAGHHVVCESVVRL